MPETIEIARFTVSPERREECLARRPAAMAALRAAFEGLIDARLAEHDDGSFTDVLRWRSREEAERAQAGVMEIPAVRDFIGTIESVTEMTHATVRDAA